MAKTATRIPKNVRSPSSVYGSGLSYLMPGAPEPVIQHIVRC
jgi:hypothetical protein